MRHKKIQNLLGAYIDGELQGKLKEVVEEHLKVCPECSKEVKFLKALNKSIKEEKMVFPADSYWDNFSRRVMEKAHEGKTPGFFSVKIPRIKWELASGLVLILLTFIVSKRMVMETGWEMDRETMRFKEAGRIYVEPKGKKLKAGKKKESLAQSKIAADVTVPGKTTPKSPVVSGKGIKVTKEKSALSAPSIAKAPEKIEIIEKTAEASGGIQGEFYNGEPEIIQRSESPLRKNEVQTAAEEKIDIVTDIKVKENFLRVNKDKDESSEVRRGLLRLLYVNANQTRKKEDVEKALREVEVYRDSYPDEFKDTLIEFSDSLRILIEEIEKESKQ